MLHKENHLSMLLVCDGAFSKEVELDQLRRCRVWARMFDDLDEQWNENELQVGTTPESFETFVVWLQGGDVDFLLKSLDDVSLLQLVKLSNELEALELLEACQTEFSSRLEMGGFVVLPSLRPWTTTEQAHLAVESLPSWIEKSKLHRIAEKHVKP